MTWSCGEKRDLIDSEFRSGWLKDGQISVRTGFWDEKRLVSAVFDIKMLYKTSENLSFGNWISQLGVNLPQCPNLPYVRC